MHNTPTRGSSLILDDYSNFCHVYLFILKMKYLKNSGCIRQKLENQFSKHIAMADFLISIRVSSLWVPKKTYVFPYKNKNK